MNEEKEWDHMVETNVVEKPMEKVAYNEIVEVMQKINSGKATGTPEKSVKMIFPSSESGFKVKG